MEIRFESQGLDMLIQDMQKWRLDSISMLLVIETYARCYELILDTYTG
jgi:hypothetical protein